MHITLRDLVSSIMITEKRAEVGGGYVYAAAKKLQRKLGSEGVVDYESASFKSFAKIYPEFDYKMGVFSLKKGYDLDWLAEQVNLNMAVDKMEALGLLDDGNASSI